MEPQRHGFHVEIEMVKERLRQEEMQSTLFANEIKALKTQEQAPDQRPSQDTRTARNMSAAQPSPKPNDGTKSSNKRDEIDEIGDSQSPGSSQGQVDRSATPDPPSSSTNSRAKRRDYASVAASKTSKNPRTALDTSQLRSSYVKRKTIKSWFQARAVRTKNPLPS